MDVPKPLINGYDYTEFDGMPLEWWRAYRKRQPAQHIEQHLNKVDKPILAAMIPDASLHKHVARVGRSAQEGHTTLLTTSGHVVQVQEAKPAAEGFPAARGAVVVSKNIDAAGVALVMAVYERDGFKLTADQIPFTSRWQPKDKDRIRTLWAEVQEKRTAEKRPAPLNQLQTVARQPSARIAAPA